MKAFVLDCSATMAWCFDDEANEESGEILNLLKKSKAIVPSIWSIEVINVLHVGERKKRINASQANTFIALLNALPIEIDMGFNDLINKNILEISRKYSISAYDAAYLELALRREIPFISFDKILCDAAEKMGSATNLTSYNVYYVKLWLAQYIKTSTNFHVIYKNVEFLLDKHWLQ